MKINHRTGSVKRLDHHKNYRCNKPALKEEGNTVRRCMDRAAIQNSLNGNDGTLFARSKEGNPWNFD
jgi:hypothetical protein